MKNKSVTAFLILMILLIGLSVLRALLSGLGDVAKWIDVPLVIVAFLVSVMGLFLWIKGWYYFFVGLKKRSLIDDLVAAIILLCFGPLGALYLFFKHDDFFLGGS